MTLEARWRRIGANDRPAGLEVNLVILGNEGEAVSLEMRARAMFSILEELPFDEAERFLAKEAPTRVLEALRPHVETIGSMTPFDSLTIPPVIVEIDSEEWR